MPLVTTAQSIAVQVATPSRAAASVSSSATPAVLSVATYGPQGPPGAVGGQGAKGETGTMTGFGQLRVADMHVDPEDYFTANVRQQLKFTADPTQTQNFLRDPFKSVMWTGNKLVARPNAYGDWQDIIVNLLVVPQFAGGRIVADLDVGTGAPVQTFSYALSGSGTTERATFRLSTQTLAGFQTNGAAIYLTGTVPFVVQSESVVYLPLSIGPGV